MKKVAVIQARMTSKRLPGKVLLPLNNKTILECIVSRVSESTELNDIIVATSNEASDDNIKKCCDDNNIKCYRGSLDNVLSRYYFCAKQEKADVIVRLTADNALIDPAIIDAALKYFAKNNFDYLYYKKPLPLGMGVEIFCFSALERAFKEASDPECIEHVTPYINKNTALFKTCFYEDVNDTDYSDLRFTIDSIEDYSFVSKIYEYFNSDKFCFDEIIHLLKIHPELIDINKNIRQNFLKYKGE